jgi:molybdopterin molybdotransferase
MLTVDEALALVVQEVRPLSPVVCSLRDARGCLLAEDLVADADQPTFDKSLVDGYAVLTADFRADSGPVLNLGESIMAGQSPSRPLAPGETAQVMTGAPVPDEADAVVMQERTHASEGKVRFDPQSVYPGMNVLARAGICRAGTLLLASGSALSPPALALLASLGQSRVRAVPRPRVSIVSTGDELVEPDRVPGPGQIRNSNAIMLESLAIDQGAEPRVLPLAPDRRNELREILEAGLGADMMLVTGGVSAGQRDLVPAVLAELGVQCVFHKVRLKPGKPIWFGRSPGHQKSQGCLVFGLPGNPVSALVGFLLFVKPAIRMLMGRPPLSAELESVRLANDFHHRGDRPTYHPARRIAAPGSAGGAAVQTVEWAGSADLVGVANADGLAVFPAGDRVFQAGEIVRFLPLG